MKTIGLLGLTFNSGNKGCEALTYSFMEILNNIYQERETCVEVIVFLPYYFKTVVKTKLLQMLNISTVPCAAEYKHLKIKKAFYKIDADKKPILGNEIKRCDCVVDFTAGDSFTDLYGRERFEIRTNIKRQVEELGIPLILGSQTVGPFKSISAQETARLVIEECREVFVRDQQSADCVENLTQRKPVLTTDIAFELPFIRKTKIEDCFNIGLNVSGLLWNGGYTKNNQFGLSVDYKKYCISLIEELLKDRNNRIYIVLHAFNQNLDYVDNDYAAAVELKKIFPDIIISPLFKTPMEAKGFISGLDILIGARMHATIAAMSAQIPVVPFSYSRKFEGLYESLNYSYMIKGTKQNTQEALDLTLQYVANIELLKSGVYESAKIIKKQRDILYKEYKKVLP